MSRSNPQPDCEDDADRQAYASALRLLARREHSELELRHKLAGRGFSEQVVERLLAQLLREGLLSDRRFAEVYIRGRMERGYGPLRIQAELRARGVSENCIQGPLAEYAEYWFRSALQQREKRFGRELPGQYPERAKQMRFLQQRGFTSDQIRALFRD